MNQSTIYKRHQRRALANMERANDPRPAAIRVLSGLPGFSMLIPPYDPTTQPTHQSSTQDSSFPNENYSTIFVSGETNVAKPETTEFSLATPLHVVLASGVAGAMAEAFYGKTTGKPTTSVSPFALKSADRVAVPLVQDMSIFRVHATMAASSTVQQPSSNFRAASKVQLMAGVSAASALFGTKALVSSWLKCQPDNPLSVASLASSASAGAVVAALTHMQSAQARFLQVPPSLAPRHIVGATLYFSTFEAMKSHFSDKNSHKASVTLVALSGATAGAIYQTALLYGQPAAVPRNLQAMVMMAAPATTTQRLVPVIVRAAPAHALLFVAYEWAQGHYF